MKTKHYRWLIVGVGVLVKATALGFGRFSYSLLLPYMRVSLGFNYIQMGLLSGGILLGYLLFSFISGLLATRFGSKKVVIASLLCSGLSMFWLSQLSSFIFLLLFTFAMGAAAAGAHISMTSLPMVWFEQRLLGRAVGIITGGTGLGILITGTVLPSFLVSRGSEGWRECWMMMAAFSFLVALVAFAFLKDRPIESRGASPEAGEQTVASQGGPRGSELSLRLIIVVYFVFGFAYIIYATYYVAFLVEDVGLSAGSAGKIWAVFGWMCMVSGLVWGFISDRAGRRNALLWNNALISLAVLLPLCLHQPVFLTLSTFLFGFTFIGTVAVIAAAIGDQAGGKGASVYGLVTLIHGIGQFLGTTSGGYLKDLTGSFQMTFLSSLTGLIVCLILIAFHKKEG
jgi:MFS family permease